MCISTTAETGEIAHLNRAMPFSGKRENAGQSFRTTGVRLTPV